MPSFLLPSFLLFSSDEYHCVLTCCNSQYAFCPEWKSLALLDARSASEKTQHHTLEEATEHPKGCKCRRSKCRKKCDHLLSSIWRIFAFAPAVICCENAVLGSWHDIMWCAITMIADCECFQMAVLCSDKCECVTCLNNVDNISLSPRRQIRSLFNDSETAKPKRITLQGHCCRNIAVSELLTRPPGISSSKCST